MKKKLLIWLLAIVMGGSVIGGICYCYREPISQTANQCWQAVDNTWQSIFGKKQTSAAEESQPNSADETPTEDYELQLKEKQYKINTLEVAISHLEDSINKLTLANNEYSATVTDLTARKTELEAQVEELESTNATAIAEKQAEIDRLTVNITELQSQIDALNQSITELANQKAELEAQVIELQEQCVTVKWERKFVTQTTDINYSKIWEADGHIYYSNGSIQKEFNKETGEWVDKTWNVNNLDGRYVWSFNGHTYYSYNSEQYELYSSHTGWKKLSSWVNYYLCGPGVVIDGECYHYSNSSFYTGVLKMAQDGTWGTAKDKDSLGYLGEAFNWGDDCYKITSGHVYKVVDNSWVEQEIMYDERIASYRVWVYKDELYCSYGTIQLKWTGTQWVDADWGCAPGLITFYSGSIKKSNGVYWMFSTDGVVYTLSEAA